MRAFLVRLLTMRAFVARLTARLLRAASLALAFAACALRSLAGSARLVFRVFARARLLSRSIAVRFRAAPVVLALQFACCALLPSPRGCFAELFRELLNWTWSVVSPR